MKNKVVNLDTWGAKWVRHWGSKSFQLYLKYCIGELNLYIVGAQHSLLQNIPQ